MAKERREYRFKVDDAATVEGIPIVVGGKNDSVPVHLDDAGEEHICLMSRDLAKQIAKHLFTTVVRVEGTARRVRRSNGVWETTRFKATGFTPLRPATLKQEVARLRAIQGEWKDLEDPLATLEEIRHGKVQ